MRKTRSAILESVHDSGKGLHLKAGNGSGYAREFDPLCQPPVESLSPKQIKQIRENSRVSQAVFAVLLNTSTSAVQKWEFGQTKPTSTALKLLHLVQKKGLEIVT
jgi:putative transcriptional regulator